MSQKLINVDGLMCLMRWYYLNNFYNKARNARIYGVKKREI